jgi:hypothetical protein
MFYQSWLKDYNVRTLIKFSIASEIIKGFTDYLFVNRYTLHSGIQDIHYLYASEFIFGTIAQSLNFLPIFALFARIIPSKIEGTMYAFLTGVANLCFGFVSPQMGYYINIHFFNVTGKHLGNYKKL